MMASLSYAAQDSKTFADDPAVIEFARDMEQRHGFNANDLLGYFSRVSLNQRVLDLMKPPTSPRQRSWERYKQRFINDHRIDGGVAFWEENRETLLRAQETFGVPPEYIVAIIGVETDYGNNTGGFKVLEALTTLAFHYPRRADFFRTELEQFLILSRENNVYPPVIKGSYAGAIGIPQFMPGSLRRYAVDFDGSGSIDLGNSVSDAIGSVARYFEQHGWQSGQPVAVQAHINGQLDQSWIEAGIRPSLQVSTLAANGVATAQAPDGTVALIDLVTPDQETEYWLGYDNFYVITRYNRSSFYAMSVFQLAQEIKARMH